MKSTKDILITDENGRPLVKRYTFGGRLTHWLTAVTFLVSMISGLAFFHPIAVIFSDFMGSFTWTRILHPFFGVAMFIFFMGLVIQFWSHNFLDKNDIKWLMNIHKILFGKADEMPPANQYNAGQKMLFWLLIILMIGLLISGVIIWRTYFSGYFSTDVLRLGAFVHSLFAFGLMCFMIVHIYAAFLADGSVEAMLYGKVSYGWLKHHHRLYYNELVKEEEMMANNRR